MQRKNGRRKKIAYVLCGILAVVLFSGCQSTAADGTDEKVFVYGDTTFNAENDESDVNPHNGYSGWACIRYGIGETLFHYSDSMEIEPWLAESYELVDDTTWRITLHEGISFTSGRTLDAEAVKECLEDLIAVQDRARGDLKIESIEADGLIVTIHTEQPVPALLNYLSDPYGCIIDMQAGVTDDGNVAGTGPYRAVQVETDQGLTLMKNDNYWNGTPKLDRIEVKTIRDGDTMTMALQSGELDAAYGLPYSNLILFRDEPYTISSADTSRTFFGQFNGSSEVLQDDRVREAVIGAIDREGFVNTLMEGNGSVAEGPFPSYFAFGDSKVQEESYDLEYSRELLAEAGWTDEDGDGYVEKDGKRLTICWLTYPSRQELPLLAESAQASLKKIGIEVQIQCTANHLELLKKGNWDVYVSAFVSAPTGDPEYFFTTHCLQDSSKNRGGYYSETLEMLEQQLSGEFDTEKRTELAIEMTQTLLDDHMFFFASHLKMSMVSGGGVTGLTAHPCDYYEITVNLDKNK
ncbi:MAG: ABC transporter substrate-binding protein [Fusicatenibacter saccharivorans]